MIDIMSMDLQQIGSFLNSQQNFRAKQIFEWLHNKNVESFDDMTNLSKELRLELKSKSVIKGVKIFKRLNSQKDDTIKYLFSLSDDNIIESVFMSYDYGNTVCISSQVGCRMGCSFCASTINGLVRNLSTGEMLSQIYTIQKDLNKKVSNIVIMGCGEPFDNFDNIIKFIEIINSPIGLNIGQRHITVSTCGLVQRIYDFADKKLQSTLAISLHAPNNELRQKIMPIAKKYSIDEILQACKYYINTTHRRITFEYSLINGINDSQQCAEQLGKLLRHILCHVNLIAVNEIKENNYKKSSQKNIDNFVSILNKYGIETTVRKKLGDDIDAACGQLRNNYLK